MADEYDDARGFEPISTLTPAGLGRGMLNRARTQGTGIARQIAQNYQDLGDLGTSLARRVFPAAPQPGGYSPADPAPIAQMTQAPFAQRSSDPGVRVGAVLADPGTYVGGGGAIGARLGARGLAQAAAARALREGAPIAEQELPRLAWNSQAGFMTPKAGLALAGTAGSGALLAKALRKKTPEQPATGAGRTTADAFQQRQADMDAATEELKRQQRGPESRYLSRMEQQLDEQGK
jgi:hypothetical protein